MKSKTKSVSKSAKRQAALGVVTRVLRLRVKDKHASFLKNQAIEVNQVWNFSQDLALKVLQREHRFISGYDIAPYTKGAAKEGLSLHSQTVQAVSEEYVCRRKQFKRAKLRWRVSHGSHRSLGWIPFKAVAIQYKNGQVWYQGKPISLWDSFGLKDYTLRSGSFSEDARGRWYLNVTVDVKKPEKSKGTASIGIDLGLKDFAAFSDGQKVEAKQFYRDLEPKLAVAQRAKKASRVKAIHAKITNRRNDFLHKLSTQLVRENSAIFVGNVNSSGLAKTGLAKSVLDAGWTKFRTQLQYKGDSAGCFVREVNESFSTQTCSSCQSRSGPKGQDGLKVRQWTCSVCGSVHDRDTNAARNILVRGMLELEKEFSAVVEGKTDEATVNKGSQESGVGHDPLAAGIPAL